MVLLVSVILFRFAGFGCFGGFGRFVSLFWVLVYAQVATALNFNQYNTWCHESLVPKKTLNSL